MNIEKTPSGDLLEIAVVGELDNESSVHFRDEIDASTRDGWHRIVVNLQEVSYLSSAGIGALVAAKKQLDQLNGLFGVFNLAPQVASVLKQVRLHDVLLCDPNVARNARSIGSMTMALSAATQTASGDAVDMEIYPLDEPQPLTCRVIGRPDALLSANRTEMRAQEVTVDCGDLCLGMGRLGSELRASDDRVGELMGVEGAAAQSSSAGGGLPDYSVAAEDFRPTMQMIYGVCCHGPLPTLIRFEPSAAGAPIGLSTLVWQAMQQTNTEASAIAILADCAGLVGAQLRRIPDAAPGDPPGPFQAPGIRNWLSFSSDRLHLQNMALIVGVAVIGELSQSSPLTALLRKMTPGRELYGHFHAAVFPFQPLKKRTLQLGPAVAELFTGGAIQDVLHLLHDDRPITGAGESELLGGACWIGGIDKIEITRD